MNLTEKIERVIKKEIKQGYMEIEEDEMMSSSVSLEELELMCLHLKNIMKKQLVRLPTSQEYKEKIEELFGVTFQRKPIILYDKGVGEVNPNNILVQSDELETSIFLSCENFIVSPFRLPEIVNYQRHFPYLVKVEDEMEKALEQEEDETLILWREMVGTKEEHHEKIVAHLHYVMRLNNYLFNNEKTHLDWLFEENPFLEVLVSTYGYNEDIELVEKIINARGIDENFYLDDLVWFKGAKKLYDMDKEPIYDGVFKIQHNTFMVISHKLEGQKFHVPTQNVYLKALHRMLVELEKEEELNEKEKKELKSYLIDFLDDFLLDSSNLESLERESVA